MKDHESTREAVRAADGALARLEEKHGRDARATGDELRRTKVTREMGEHLRLIAGAWRKGKTPGMEQTGYVLIFRGTAAGWVSSLAEEDPRGWQPGIIAVPLEGALYEAQGGDGENGAVRWVEMEVLE